MAADAHSPIDTLFPALRSLRRHRAAERDVGRGGDHPDEALVRACGALRAGLSGTGYFTPDDPAHWDQGKQVAAHTEGLVRWIAATRCHTRTGLRAKALALYALLGEADDGGLYPDAAAPDVLAWSLVQDILVTPARES